MNINHCIHCGTESEASWRFCRRCGTALENLEALAKTAQCSNCDTALADGWRFCPNCGTDTDGASPIAPGGLSSDEVADLIATPADTTAEPASDVAVSTPSDLEPTPDPEPTPPAPAPSDAAAADTGETEPVVSAPKVSFEPAVGEPAPPIKPPPAPADMPAARELDMMTSPPAPPADPSLGDVEEIVASRAAAEAPPAPRLDAPIAAVVEPVHTAPSAEPEADVPAILEVVDVAPIESTTADPFAGEIATPVDEAPAVIIPPARPEPEVHIPEPPADSQPAAIRPQIPRPIGAPHEQSKTAIPRPLGTPPEDRPPEPAPEPRHRVLTTTPTTVTDDLPPIDGRTFTNPGLIGQGVQLTMLIAAAFGVAMIVAFTVLNNRLDAYATTGESLPRVESAQSIINTWMRPLLVVALLLAYVAAVLWARRVLRNISVFDKFVPETALWMWIIPGANIFVLWQHFEMAWKGSDVYAKNDEQWRKGKSNWWSFAFALLAIIAFGVIIFAWLFMSSETFENAIDANAVSIIGYALVVASLLCGVRAVGNVVDRQQSRVQQYD